MVTELVFFPLPRGTTREELLAKYRQTAPAWSQNEDLVQKFYFFDAVNGRGGGVYVWKSKDAAHRWHGDEYRARIRALYGAAPELTCFDTLRVVDNVRELLSEPAEA